MPGFETKYLDNLDNEGPPMSKKVSSVIWIQVIQLVVLEENDFKNR